MDQDSAHMVAASKVPMLKPENGATFPNTTTMEGVVTVMPIITAEEKELRGGCWKRVEKKFGRNALQERLKGIS
ncbi:hypothetical protein Tco_0083926 [Tanacetum coccineum]